MNSRGCTVLIGVLLVGCGGAGQSKPKPISGPAKQVADVVQRLEHATATHDFTTICNQLLARATRKQAGGSQCPAVLGARARDVSHPRIVIKTIEVSGPTARATVQTTATGQAATTDVIDLVRERGEYRVLSLGR